MKEYNFSINKNLSHTLVRQQQIPDNRLDYQGFVVSVIIKTYVFLRNIKSRLAITKIRC